MTELSVNEDRMVQFLVDLLNIPSPTGDSDKAVAFCEQAFGSYGLELRRTVKGGLAITWDGQRSDRPRGLTAHVDTLGAMVREIKCNGRLMLTQIGGYPWPTVEGEGVTVMTASGRRIRGTILPTKASAHIHGAEVKDLERKAENMEVRLDIRSTSAEETRVQGIEVGDFVYLDPRVEVSETGFIRSRHLDDKAGVAAILGAVQAMRDAGLQPAQRTTLLISNYEEVGHGASAGWPSDLVELLTVDMAAVGQGQNSDESSACICVKDSGGPYHIDMTRRLTALAKEHAIPYKLDTYPYYGSDGEALWRAGADIRVGLVGPGVDASHSYERTHRHSLVNTAKLVAEYLVHEG